MRPTSSAFKYREDIDGLRALAVIAVIGFHAFPQFVTGGYIGVDVFFVVSGFLISTIIINGLKDGSFSFVDFYARRIKRIFPALIIVLAGTLALGWLDLLPNEFSSLGKHVIAGAGFANNFVLWREAGYFNPGAYQKPLLHLWSLGIEEQFYLGWPLVALIAWKFGRQVFVAAALIVVISFTLSLFRLQSNPVEVFYLPIYRAWELLMGGCLACLLQYDGEYSTPRSRLIDHHEALLREFASVGGIVLILLSIILFDAHTPFPGSRALLPTIGSVLVILAGPSAWLNRTVLAHPIAVRVGLISYPLYLWHWPLISIPAILQMSTAAMRTAAVLLSFILAWATYRYLELPVRRASRSISAGLLACLSIVATAGYLAYDSVILPKSASPELAVIAQAMAEWSSPIGKVKPLQAADQTFWQDGDGDDMVMFIGDSNMEQYFPRIHKLIAGRYRNVTAIFAVHPGCIPIPNVARRAICPRFVERAYEFARTPRIQTVAIAALWFLNFRTRTSTNPVSGTHLELASSEGADRAFAALQEELAKLSRLGKRTFLILNIPTGEALHPSTRIVRSLVGRTTILPTAPSVSKKELLSRYGSVHQRLIQIAAATGTIVIDPLDYLCDLDECPSVEKNGEPRFKNNGHLSASFVREKVHYIDRILPKQVTESAH